MKNIFGRFQNSHVVKGEIPLCLSNNFLSKVDKNSALPAPAPAYDHHQKYGLLEMQMPFKA